jgi:hypothetical protein
MERVSDYLLADHRRLEEKLAAATREPAFDHAAFEEFRAGLLRHIAIEEKLLFPAARRARGGTPIARAHQLRIEHGAIGILLVPSPDHGLCGELASVLAGHNALEEGSDGVYAECERLIGAEQSRSLLDRAREFPAVRVAKHFDGPTAFRTAQEALASAARIAAPKSSRST